MTGRHWTGKMAQLVKDLPYKHEDWSLDLQHPQKKKKNTELQWYLSVTSALR